MVVLSAVMDDVEELVRTCCIRGYHVYKETWEVTCGEVLVCERDIRNMEDGYAVAVKKDGTTVRHLPRKVSRISSLFIRQGGIIQCTVTGLRRYSEDLPQGGLELPCLLLFRGTPKDIGKLKGLWKKVCTAHL